MNSYDLLKQKQQQEYDEFTKGKTFCAFNLDQFHQGLKDINFDINGTEKLVFLGVGTYIRKSQKQELDALFLKHRQEINRAMEEDSTGEGFIFDMFNRELSNHEYAYTGDVSRALEACGISVEDLHNSKKLRYGLKKACNHQRYRYLTEKEAAEKDGLGDYSLCFR